jgi:DNA-binding HxlR family transcriptional regulator
VLVGALKYKNFFDFTNRSLLSVDIKLYCMVKYNCKLQIDTKGSDTVGICKLEKPLPACPVETTLQLIGNKWKVLILRDLMDGTKRFGELKKSIGTVSQKVLTAQLRDMEACGLVSRKVYAEVPPRVEYSLTELGKSLKPILYAMRDWGLEYKTVNE